MRRPVFQSSREAAKELFARAHHVQLASTLPDGEPVQKTLHAVIDGEQLLFHAAPVGEKIEIVDRRAVVTAVEVVAQIPSYFLDPERACPATTLYRSAQAHGVVREVTDPSHKARVLSALMAKFQPEGGFASIDAESPMYRKVLAGLFVGGIELDRVDGKDKLMQHKRPAEREKVIEALFRRGAPGDCAAIAAIVSANPYDPTPELLRGPHGTSFCLAPHDEDATRAAELLANSYWNDLFDRPAIARAHRASSAWVVLHSPAGELVGSARALSDGAKHAWIYDVIVAEALRHSRAGTRLIQLLLGHPQVRGARFVHLGTRDAQGFYERFGFTPSSTLVRPYVSTAMVLDRSAGAVPSASSSTA